MRTALVICLALAQAAMAQTSARADNSYSAVNAMRLAFSQVHSVLATERFSNGDVATVKYNSRIASTSRRRARKSSSAVIWSTSNLPLAAGYRLETGRNTRLCSQPPGNSAARPNIDLRNLYTIVPLGTKTIGTALVRGFRLHDASGGNDETVWIGPDNLPVAARIEMPSETIEIHYTGYNTSVRVGHHL